MAFEMTKVTGFRISLRDSGMTKHGAIMLLQGGNSILTRLHQPPDQIRGRRSGQVSSLRRGSEECERDGLLETCLENDVRGCRVEAPNVAVLVIDQIQVTILSFAKRNHRAVTRIDV